MIDASAAGLLRELEARGAILSGHFRLSSGRHSNAFVQKFRILEDPALVEHVAAVLAAQGATARADGRRERRGRRDRARLRDGAPARDARDLRRERGRRSHAAPGVRARPRRSRVSSSKTSSRPGGSVREVLEVVRARGATVAGGRRDRAPGAGRVRRPDRRAARPADRIVRAGELSPSAPRENR